MSPKGVKTLEISLCNLEPPEDITFPDLIAELRIMHCSVRNIDVLLSKLPDNLRMLELTGNPIESLEGFEFPTSLEVLNLSYCALRQIDNIDFPSLLKELNLQGNRIKSLDNARLPNLTLLNISRFDSQCRSMSNVNLPSTLVTLLARNNAIEDWSFTRLPKGLKELAFNSTENA